MKLPGKTTLCEDENRERSKMAEMKVYRRQVSEQRAERYRQKACWLTGGIQLANHKGSSDAGVASEPFSRGRKLKVHGLIVPIKPHTNMHAQTIYTHTHTPPVANFQCMPLLSPPIAPA